MRDNIILPHKIYRSMQRLSDAECGRLFRALLVYSMKSDDVIKLQGREEMLFDVYTQEIDEDIAAYESKCETNRRNAQQRTQANASDGIQSLPVGATGANNNNNNNNNYKDNNKYNKENDHTRKSAESVPIGFDDFWSVYPRKVSKQAAIKAWKAAKIGTGLVDTIIEDVKRRCNTEWKDAEIQFIPHPTTYLNQRRWEDETAPVERTNRGERNQSTNPALNYDQRQYTDEDFGDDFFIDLDKYAKGG